MPATKSENKMTQSLSNYSVTELTNKNICEPRIVFNFFLSGALTAFYNAINFTLILMYILQLYLRTYRRKFK